MASIHITTAALDETFPVASDEMLRALLGTIADAFEDRPGIWLALQSNEVGELSVWVPISAGIVGDFDGSVARDRPLNAVAAPAQPGG